MAKNIGVFTEHAKRDQIFKIYAPKRDDKHSRRFHMGVPPGPGGGDSPIKMTAVLVVPFRLKNLLNWYTK